MKLKSISSELTLKRFFQNSRAHMDIGIFVNLCSIKQLKEMANLIYIHYIGAMTKG
jgi:hypothetical protein